MVLSGDGTFIVGDEATADWKLLGNRLIFQARSSRKSNGGLAVRGGAVGWRPYPRGRP